MEEATHRQPQSVPLIAAPVALLALLVLGIAAPAAADEDRPLTPAQKRAGELFERADTHYAAGRYEQAAKYFLQGYKIAPHPEFLYSLGNTYERMGEYAKAAEYLKRYVRSPLAQDVVSVKERIKRLEAAAEERRKQLEEPADDGGEDGIEVENLEGDDDDDAPVAVVDGGGGPPSRAHYYWFAGAGVGLIGAAAFGLLSRSAATTAAGSCSGGLCEDAARTELDREKRYALLADVSLVAGIGAAVVGAVVLFRSRRSNSRDQARALHVDPVITAEGGGLALSGRF